MEKFFYESTYLDRAAMQARIISTSSALGWQQTIEYILKKGISFSELNVAEVGCGSGTFSLSLNLLGAKTTLIDFDQDALNTAKQVFSLYKREADFIQADVSKAAPESLKNKFDLIISGGLAEHFVGEAREKCIAFHKDLLRAGGIAYIGVPNKLSPGYQIVKGFKTISGKWKVGVEKPFTYQELKKIGRSVGFKDVEVIGNYPLKKDLKDYSLGLISAILDVLPSAVRDFTKRVRRQEKVKESTESKTIEFREEAIIRERVENVKRTLAAKKLKSLKDYLSAGIILFGFVADDINNK